MLLAVLYRTAQRVSNFSINSKLLKRLILQTNQCAYWTSEIISRIKNTTSTSLTAYYEYIIYTLSTFSYLKYISEQWWFNVVYETLVSKLIKTINLEMHAKLYRILMIWSYSNWKTNLNRQQKAEIC